MIDKAGMMVLLVNTDSPAWHAGLKVGDVLVEIDGIKINNINDYYSAVAATQSKKKVFVIIRSGDEKRIEVSIRDRADFSYPSI